MEQFIIDCIKSVDCSYVKINNESDLLIIYDLLKYNVIGDKYNSIICFYYGFYYGKLIKDYDLMKKYYLMSIDCDNSDAMSNLAHHYQLIEKNYDLMKKYYLMAINCNNVHAMYHLAYYYQCIEKDYDLMKKYYLMAINCNNTHSMYNLAYYYQFMEKDYDSMKKYYLMVINCTNNNNDPSNYLGYCYQSTMQHLAYHYQHIEINYDLMKKYYFMAIKNNSTISICYCLKIYGTITQENIDDAMYFYNIANKPATKYDAMTKAINNNYMINNNHVTDYMQSINISILLSKYNNMCVSIKQVFMNYRHIMLLLRVIKKSTNIVPKHVKLIMISLLCV